ncbi:MAG: protein kinase [Aggregatilineales bacterium]
MEQAADGLIGNRYRLVRSVGEGGMGVVFEAEDRLSGWLVALKRIKVGPEHDYSNTYQRQQLAREFQILAGLRHPHIISVLDFGYDKNWQPYFTMPLLQGARNILDVAAERMLHGKVRLLIETCQALSYLHRHGILHLDLKPNNILVEPDGHVRVLDFGIATDLFSAPETNGTLEYMAPEMLNSEVVSPASDLYALGVIAYQIFAGKHPFASNGIAQLIYRVLTELPDPELMDAPPAVRQVALRLLARAPEERYRDAYEAMLAFYDAIQIQPSESRFLRESVLQSPKFVGREEELRAFDEVLTAALQGHGTAWLISGESGVGKSRLLDEMRIRALVKGVMVLHGQYSEGAGGLYSAWRTVLRQLLLSAPVDDDEALILKTIVPDLERLIGRRVEGTARTPDENQMAKLLIALFERIEQSALLIIDDLQWATDSLNILRQLSRVAPQLPLLVVAAYRSDDNQYLYGKLPDMRLIKLQRFTAEEVRALCHSVIGNAEHLNNFLFEQTEGNAFYLTESLRILAETLGSLEHIRQAGLPAQVFSERMLLIAKRRLERLPERYQRLVQIAAVIGREIDFDLLERVGGTANYDDWLIKCVDAAIFRIRDGSWYFTHDKLREGILHTLSAEVRRAYHRAAAEGIEALHPDRTDHELALALHWREAGDLAKSARYWLAYASRAIRSGGASAVQPHLAALLEQIESQAQLTAERIQLHMLLGRCESEHGAHECAKQHYEDAYSLALSVQEISAQAKALFRLGEVEYSRSNFTSSVEHLKAALALFEGEGDFSGAAQSLYVLGHIQAVHMNLDEADRYHQAALQLAERHQDIPNLARAHMGLSDVARRRRDYQRAEHHARMAMDCYTTQGEDRLLATIIMRLSLSYMGEGRFEEALNLAEQSIRISERLGDVQEIMSAVGNIGFALAQQGRFEESRRYFERCIAHERKYGNLNALAVRLGALAQVNVQLGDWQAVRANLYEWLQLAHRLNNWPGLLHGFYGMVDLALHDGNAVQAAEWIGVIEANAVAEYLDPDELARLRAACLAQLDQNQLAESLAYGKMLDLNSLAESLLNDSEGIFGALIAA